MKAGANDKSGFAETQVRGEFADFSLAAQANLALAQETKMVPRDSLPQR